LLKPHINPTEQVQSIRNNISTYFGVLFNTIFTNKTSYYLNGFFGLLGWADTPFPKLLRNLYFLILLITAIGISDMEIHFGLKNKIILFILFIAGILLIETALYIYSSNVGDKFIQGVQGRYFIPFAPLFFLLFYNNYISRKLNLAFSLRKKEYLRAKPNAKSIVYKEIQNDEQLFSKSLHLFIICFIGVTLISTVIILLSRYYYT
jgi:uncharacterized membrane protein